METIPTQKTGTPPTKGLLFTLSSALDRQINKVKAGFWAKTSSVLETVDNSVAQPLLKYRNEAVDTVTSVVNPTTIKIALAVIAIGIVGYFLMQVNRFRK